MSLPPEEIRTRETDFADVFSGVGQTNKQRIALSSRRQYGAVAETGRYYGLFATGNEEPGLKAGVNEKGLVVVSASRV